MKANKEKMTAEAWTCPACGSENYECGDTNHKGDYLRRHMHCNDCNAGWTQCEAEETTPFRVEYAGSEYTIEPDAEQRLKDVAPELLAALECLSTAGYIDEEGDYILYADDSPEKKISELEIARAAIAKAKGGAE